MTQSGVSVALACRTFGVSETCYRYSPKLDQENERIADLLEHFHDLWNLGIPLAVVW